ncbi:DNA-directed RNA polymerase [Lecanora helva]
MFARASKRSLPQDVYRQSLSCLEGLQLPFLCPALFGQSLGEKKASSITKPRSRRRSERSPAAVVKRSGLVGFAQSRYLASAATAENASQRDTYLPWDYPGYVSQSYGQTFTGQSLDGVSAFDPGSPPLIIKDSLTTQPVRFRTTRDAISGDLNEIHQTLHACLQVGRLERAATLVRRLNEIYKPDAPGLLAAHNDYITELSHRIVQKRDQRLLEHLQRWFQIDLVDNRVEPDETTYAMMIRASSQRLDSKKDRTVRRYLNLAQEAGLSDETQALLSSYDDIDFNIAHYDKPHTVSSPAEDFTSEFAMPQTTLPEPKKSIEDVRHVEQKGAGLTTLKKALSIFSKGELSLSDAKDLLPTDRQRLLEENTVNAAIDRWREEDAHLKSLGINSSLSNTSVGSMMWEWHQKLIPVIEDDLRKSQEAEQKLKKSKSDEELLLWGPYLQSLPPEKTAAITILTAVKICSTETLDNQGVRTHNLVQGIGNAIQSESIAEVIRKKKKNKKLQRRAATVGLSSHGSTSNGDISESQEYEKLTWVASSKIKLAAALFAHLIQIAKSQVSKEDPKTGKQVQVLQPVFFHSYQYILGKRVGVVRLNSNMMDRLAKTPVVSTLAKYLPMVCEPKPWSGYHEGGFLDYATPAVRLHTSDAQSKQYAMVATRNGDMTQVFAGLDVLAKTPWNINRYIFDVMLEAWNSGQAIAKIPPENSPDDLPPEPAASDDPAVRYIWMKKVRESENYKAGLKSQRCFQNFQLEVARAYLGETFYFPHNCDFRGRAYAMTPFLNHMGADNVRGLLMFAHGKELTSTGLWWLKVHLANVYGYDKASFADRLAFTETHLSDIRDSVDQPLNGKKWWLMAEDPWQCLAACKELTEALALPDPTKYVSKIAIHQDGTCNGLQHYAALGGDVVGAQQVNLEPGDRPSDIYTAVAELVKGEISKEAVKGNGLAKALDGRVTRKVVKQTVMTNVYGVTFTGAKRQVRRQLDDLSIDFPDSKEINRITAAPYIAKKIFAALAKMFNGAHDIQKWLVDCAGRISESLSPEQIAHVGKSARGEHIPSIFKKTPIKTVQKDQAAEFKTTVIWTTPLKMPVVQPYRKQSTRRIETNLQKVTIRTKSAADPVHKAKQLQAFPPNFIHSLDATHMFLTALKCHEVGMTFAAIHDSFWTHAGDVDTMNRVIRDAFIRMHSEDIIGRLAAEFKARYQDYMRLASVRVDTPVGQKIMAWRRANSKGALSTGHAASKAKTVKQHKWEELLLERRRLDLLASEDAKEQEEGRRMVTPGKLFSEEADEKSLAPLDAKPAVIGLTPGSRDAKLKANQQLTVGDEENAEPTDSVHDVELDESFEDSATAIEANDKVSDGEEEMVGSSEDVKDTSTPINARRYARKIWVWLPLTFPPVPKKGDFDVTRLKDSQYFFS